MESLLLNQRSIKNRWETEIKIPLNEIDALKSKKIKVNIRRKQQRLKDGALWVNNWDYNPEKYGELILK